VCAPDARNAYADALAKGIFPTTDEQGMHVSVRYPVSVLSMDVCDEIATLRLSRPEGFDFLAGQWLRLSLLTSEGEGTQTFTIASAPADDWLEVTTRLSGSPFKATAATLKVGDEVEIAGPGGRLSLPASTPNPVFLVGGVGITPARSLLRDALNQGRVFSDALVVYGNRTPSCVPYAEEIAAMQPAGVRLALVFEDAPPSWNGPRGFIDANLVRSLVDTVEDRMFVVSGPPVMVTAMERVLDELGIDKSRRAVESFGPPIRVTGGGK